MCATGGHVVTTGLVRGTSRCRRSLFAIGGIIASRRSGRRRQPDARHPALRRDARQRAATRRRSWPPGRRRCATCSTRRGGGLPHHHHRHHGCLVRPGAWSLEPSSGVGCWTLSMTSISSGARCGSSFRPSCSCSAVKSEGQSGSIAGGAAAPGAGICSGCERQVEAEPTGQSRAVHYLPLQLDGEQLRQLPIDTSRAIGRCGPAVESRHCGPPPGAVSGPPRPPAIIAFQHRHAIHGGRRHLLAQLPVRRGQAPTISRRRPSFRDAP